MLSLKSRAETWLDATAIHDVYAALVSTPAITKLSLGVLFLGGQTYDSVPASFRRTPIRSDVESLAMYAPRLEHLSFVVWSPLRRHGAFDFVQRIFASSHWLDLKNPTSTIREVTLVSAGTPPDDLVAELDDRRLLISEVRRFVKDEMTVRFEDEEPVEVQRAVWGW